MAGCVDSQTIKTATHGKTTGYDTNIEPDNCSVLDRAWNRKPGSLQYIEPDEEREFNMEIGVLDGADEMRAFERKVERGLAK